MGLSDSIKERCSRCWGTGRLSERGRFGAVCPECDGTGEDALAAGGAGLDVDLDV